MELSPAIDFPISVSESHFAVKIGAGTLVDSVGTALQIPAQTVTLLPNLTQYIVATLKSGEVFAVRRHYHDGAILLATVTTGELGVTGYTQPNTFQFPASTIERTKAKLRNGEPVAVLLLGTSLINYGATAANKWRNLLFDTGSSATGFNVQGAANVTQLVYSMGGTGPELSWAMLARPIGQLASTVISDTRGLGIKAGPAAMQNLTIKTAIPENWLTTHPDLVIIDGYNATTTYRLGYIEAQLRMLRRAGADVIILGTGPNTSDATFRYSDGTILKAICENNGFAFCDLNAFQRSALEAGDTTLWADGVHPSDAGHQVYAARLRDLLNDYQQAPAPVFMGRSPAYRQEIGTSYRNRMPEIAEILVTSARTNGATGQACLASSQAATVNPLIAMGIYTSSTSITVLNPTEWMVFGHPLALSYSVLLELNPGDNLDISVYREGGVTLIKNVTKTVGVGVWDKQPWCQELLTIDETINTKSADTQQNWWGYTGSPFGNSALRVTNTHGTADLRVIGAVVQTLRHREVDHGEWIRGATGTWALENCYWTTDAFKMLYCDTTNATLTLSYFGRGICLVFQGGNSCGQISVTHNGDVDTKDLYAAASAAFQYYLAAPQVEAASGDWEQDPRWHSVKITLTGVNGSAVASASGLRRCALVGAYIIE